MLVHFPLLVTTPINTVTSTQDKGGSIIVVASWCEEIMRCSCEIMKKGSMLTVGHMAACNNTQHMSWQWVIINLHYWLLANNGNILDDVDIMESVYSFLQSKKMLCILGAEAHRWEWELYFEHKSYQLYYIHRYSEMTFLTYTKWILQLSHECRP